MKVKILSLLIVLPLLTSLSSCSNDDEDKTALLTRKWRLVKYEEDNVDISEDRLHECNEDDHIEFFSDGTFHEEVGTELCTVSNQDKTGTWTWKSNQIVLSIHYANALNPVDWTLIQLTSSTLKASLVLSDGRTRVVTWTAI